MPAVTQIVHSFLRTSPLDLKLRPGMSKRRWNKTFRLTKYQILQLLFELFLTAFGMITAFFPLTLLFSPHCSPHTRQACCDSACTLWCANSLIKVWMRSLWCWLLLLVVRQVWFFGKYAVFAPEIWSSASGNRNQKGRHQRDSFFRQREHACSRGRRLTVAHSQCVSSYVLGVPFIFSPLAAFVVQSTPPQECKIETLQQDFATPVCLSLGQSVSGWSGNSLDADASLRRRCCLFYSAYSVVMSALSYTSFKWNHLGSKDNTGMLCESIELTFLPRLEGISMFVCFLLKCCLCLSAVGLYSRSCTEVYSSGCWPLWHTPILHFGECLAQGILLVAHFGSLLIIN